MVGETPSLTSESAEKSTRQQVGCIIPPPPPPRQALPQQGWLSRQGEYIRSRPHAYNLSGVPRQRNRAQMKEESKTSERELSEEIANLSDGEFKALAIKRLTELIGLVKNEKTNERYLT